MDSLDKIPLPLPAYVPLAAAAVVVVVVVVSSECLYWLPLISMENIRQTRGVWRVTSSGERRESVAFKATDERSGRVSASAPMSARPRTACSESKLFESSKEAPPGACKS